MDKMLRVIPDGEPCQLRNEGFASTVCKGGAHGVFTIGYQGAGERILYPLDGSGQCITVSYHETVQPVRLVESDVLERIVAALDDSELADTIRSIIEEASKCID